MELPGDPSSKGRPRGGRGHHYTPASTRAAENVLRAQVLARSPREPYLGPVALELVLLMETPKGGGKDGDNLAKLVADCLQRPIDPKTKRRLTYGGIILNDAQIKIWDIRVVCGVGRGNGRTLIGVRTLAPGELAREDVVLAWRLKYKP